MLNTAAFDFPNLVVQRLYLFSVLVDGGNFLFDLFVQIVLVIGQILIYRIGSVDELCGTLYQKTLCNGAGRILGKFLDGCPEIR